MINCRRLGSIIAGCLRPVTRVPWWQFLTLGIVELGTALTDVAAVVVLGLWAWRSAPVPVGSDMIAA